MKCCECRRENREREAVVLCNHCLAALCEMHLCSIEDPVTAIEPMVKVVVLAAPARRFLRATWRAALRQPTRTATKDDPVADLSAIEKAGQHHDAMASPTGGVR